MKKRAFLAIGLVTLTLAAVTMLLPMQAIAATSANQCECQTSPAPYTPLFL